MEKQAIKILERLKSKCALMSGNKKYDYNACVDILEHIDEELEALKGDK